MPPVRGLGLGLRCRVALLSTGMGKLSQERRKPQAHVVPGGVNYLELEGNKRVQYTCPTLVVLVIVLRFGATALFWKCAQVH